MVFRFSELKSKQVVNINDGAVIGCVDDLCVNSADAQVVSIVVYGRSRFFGIFGKEDDTVILWKNIEIIGEDAVLVSLDSPCRPRKRKKFDYFRRLFK